MLGWTIGDSGVCGNSIATYDGSGGCPIMFGDESGGRPVTGYALNDDIGDILDT